MTFQRMDKIWIAIGVLVTLLAGALLGAAVFFFMRQNILDQRAGGWRTPRVAIESGKLRGVHRPASSKGIPAYVAFLGIPYAKPPLGELRFKSPRLMDPWDGVRNAKLFGERCIQGPVDAQVGSEDCLHLNVYSPWVQQEDDEKPAKLPVLVHVHGGAMKEGTGNVIRPDYFIAKGIVVVTFNYRLGHFGFFSLNNDVAPGNVGFKDMVLVLKWIRRNIHNFGGDPNQVTINGCSSAGVSVDWMTLLPDTEGLFHRAIIKSGSALLPWSYTDHQLDLSKRTVSFLKKWWPNNTEVESLHQRDTWDMKVAFSYAEKHRPKDTPETLFDLTVSLEKRRFVEEPRLILKDGESYLLEPTRSSVPIIIGMTDCEFDYYGDMYYRLGEFPDVDSPGLTGLLPRSVLPTTFAQQALRMDTPYDHNWEEVTEDFRAVMFNLSAVDTSCDLMCRWESFYSNAYYKWDTARSMRLHARHQKEPVYGYSFDYPLDGTCTKHARDDRMVWPQDETELIALNTTTPLSLNTLRQVTFFTNFAKFGKPVPKTDPVVMTTEWLPMGKKDSPDVFMSIGKTLSLQTGDIIGKFGPFWAAVYKKYRDGKGI